MTDPSTFWLQTVAYGLGAVWSAIQSYDAFENRETEKRGRKIAVNAALAAFLLGTTIYRVSVGP